MFVLPPLQVSSENRDSKKLLALGDEKNGRESQGCCQWSMEQLCFSRKSQAEKAKLAFFSWVTLDRGTGA